MNKYKYLIISIITIFIFNTNVYAASGKLSVSSSSIHVGDSFTISANLYSMASWNVHVSASGPVKGCSINQAQTTDDAMDTNKTFKATCKATGTGTIYIRLTGDITSASDGKAVKLSDSKTVTVSKKQSSSNINNGNNNNKSNNKSNNKTTNNTTKDNKSKNNNIKNLTVDGYKLTKINNNNYSLIVPYYVENINIKATAQDSKAKVSGTGKHILKVGQNNIEIVVTAENGSKNKINIKVNRKDSYYIEDLNQALTNDKLTDINIILNADTKISIDDLEKIKESKKTINFNYYDESKILLYTWIIDGSKLKYSNELDTSILFDSNNKKEILKLSNYADGIIISLKQENNIPNGIKIKLYLSNKYDSNDLVNIYAYMKNNNKLKLLISKIKVENGYIEFTPIETSDYLITMSNIPHSEEIATSSDNHSSSIIPIIIIIILLFIIMLLTILLIKKKKRKNEINNTNAVLNNYEILDANKSTNSSSISSNPNTDNTSSNNNLND